MQSKIHTYTSAEPMLKVNAYIIEASKELVIVDTTLTMSDSKALKQSAEALGKPVAAILLTHGHPDHIAGAYNLCPDGNIPIYALPSVKKMMEETEAAKHLQWSAMFGPEWIPRWVYPNQLVENGDSIKIAGLTFTVVDIGSGGDCDANSFWLLEDENKAGFIGDFIYKNNHTYMNDGSILRWVANIDQYSPLLKDFRSYYVGHGQTSTFEDLEKQQEYLLNYCSNVLKATNGTGIFNNKTKNLFEQIMLTTYPDFGCQFMAALSAEKVGSELVSLSH